MRVYKRFSIVSRVPYDLATERVYEAVPELRKIKCGVCVLQRRGPGQGALTINENADPTVRDDFLSAIPKVAEFGVPKETKMIDRVKFQAAILPQSLVLLIRNGRFIFGTWQGIYLCSFVKTAFKHDLTITATSVNPSDDAQREFSFVSPSRGSHPIDELLCKAMFTTVTEGSKKCDDDEKKGKPRDLAVLTSMHTSCSMCLCDGAKEKDFGEQFERMLNRVVPERWNREFLTHTYEGDDDMPGHLKSSICGVSLVASADILLERSRGVSVRLNEHRNCGGWGGGHRRRIAGLLVRSNQSQSRRVLLSGAGDITSTCCKLAASIVETMAKKEQKRTPTILSLTALGEDAAFSVITGDDAHGSSLLAAFKNLGRGGIALSGKTLSVGLQEDGRLELGSDQSVWVVSTATAKIPVHVAVIFA